jgi:hypothetical protein
VILGGPDEHPQECLADAAPSSAPPTATSCGAGLLGARVTASPRSITWTICGGKVTFSSLIMACGLLSEPGFNCVVAKPTGMW